MQRYLRLIPLLFLTLLFTACGDLEGTGNVDQPDRSPEGAFGVSDTFDGPYLGLDGAISEPTDEQILEVEPGGKFYARAVYESLTGITDITVSLINPNPEGLAGPLDPAQSFFTLGEPTSISEPGGGCELTGEDAQVICIYEIQVAEDAVNIDELEGAGDEFAYIFSPQATNAAGATSDENLRGYVRIVSDTAEKPEPETCTDPVEIPDEVLESVIRISLNIDISTRPLTCEDLASLTELVNVGENIAGLSNLEGLQFAANLERIVLNVDDDREEATSIGDLSPLAGLTALREINVETKGETIEDINPLRDLVSLEVIALGGNRIEDISALADLTKLEDLFLQGNQISDLEPLVTNEGLGEGDSVVLDDNPLETCPGTQDRADIDALRERGVLVDFDAPENCDADGGSEETCTSPVEIPDEFVERDVRETLDKPQGELTCEDLERLTELTTGPEGDDDRPFSLVGLQYATNLERLVVVGNRLSDLEPLRNLPKLTELVLDSMGGGTTIDIAALAEVETLEILKFSFESSILSLEPLEGLTNLRVLELEEIDVEEGDAGVLQSLIGLQRLVINGVGGDGISGVRTLEPLVDNEGLGEGDTLDLRNNLDLGLDTYFIDTCPGTEDREAIETLLARGVEVAFDEPTGCRPEGTEKAEVCSGPVEVPDEALARSIRATLERGALQGGLTGENLAELRRLSDDAGVQSLEGLQCAVNLQVLSIENSQVEDVSPLQNLTRLESLRVDGGQIDDLMALQGLVGLQALFFYENDVDDLSPLTSLVRLSTVGFAGNEVSDLSPLVELAGAGSLTGKNSFVDVRENPADVCPGSDAREDIDTLVGRGVRVLFNEPEDCGAN